MKEPLRTLFWITSAVVLLIASAVAYSTVKGHLVWFFRVSGTVTVNGHKTNGYLHANTQRTLLLVTRTDAGRPETYLVPVQDGQMIIDCAKWHPIQVLPTAIGDVNPPCSGYDTPLAIQDSPTSATQITSRRSLEFSTASGKKVKAEW